MIQAATTLKKGRKKKKTSHKQLTTSLALIPNLLDFLYLVKIFSEIKGQQPFDFALLWFEEEDEENRGREKYGAFCCKISTFYFNTFHCKYIDIALYFFYIKINQNIL